MKTKTNGVNLHAFDAHYVAAICELSISEIESAMNYINKNSEKLPKADEMFEFLNGVCSRLEVARQVAELALLEPSGQLELTI